MTGAEFVFLEMVAPAPAGRVGYTSPELSIAPAEYPAPPGTGLVLARFAVRVELARPRDRLVAVYLRIAVPGASVAPDDDHPAVVSHLDGGGMGWLLGDPLADGPLDDRAVEVTAVVQLPLAAETLTGTLNVDTTTVRRSLAGKRREHASSVEAGRFAAPLPDGWAAVDRSTPATTARPAPRLPLPAVRLCYAVDIERFRRFTGSEVDRAQERFVGALAEARRRTGIAENTVSVQLAGDGEFTVLAPGADQPAVLPAFVAHLKAVLGEVNADLTEHARLRLRLAVHSGQLGPAAGGWSGPAATAVHRLLDSEVLRSALAGHPLTDLALIVSDEVYREVIATDQQELDAGGFTRVVAELPGKDFAEPAWLSLLS